MNIEKGILGPHHKKEKLEQPERVRDLDPVTTLKALGIRDKEVICDIGAGSGLFSLAAARMADVSVIAIETDAAILTVLAERAASEGLNNVRTLFVEGFHYDIAAHSVDRILLVAVLHEIAEKAELFREMKRILKPAGTISIIEFRKEKTPMGPPVECRIGADDMDELCRQYGLNKCQSFVRGQNFYCQVYEM